MSLWDKVSAGVNKAAKAAESAVDEGKQRLQAYQARQRADKKAESLGYAVARAKAENREPDEASMKALVDSVIAADQEATLLEKSSREPEAASPKP
jgi:hypothetical protein